jgi:hypothetical protein
MKTNALPCILSQEGEPSNPGVPAAGHALSRFGAEDRPTPQHGAGLGRRGQSGRAR